jgi:hypothetical protein
MLDAPSVMLLTAHAAAVAPRVLEAVNAAAALGEGPEDMLAACGIVAGGLVASGLSLSPDEALVWQRARPRHVERVRLGATVSDAR